MINTTHWNKQYRFAKATWEALRNSVVLNLRKDGFTATREYDRENHNELLVTNANPAQVALSCGKGWVVCH